MSNRRSQLRWLCLVMLSACGSGQFSEDFAQEIQRDCIQTLSCNAGGGVEDCVAKEGHVLDNASPNQQQAFVDTVARCEQNVGCAYVNCTVSDPNAGFAGARQAQIMYDCQQQAVCRGGTANYDVQQCVLQTSARLNAAADQQVTYDARWGRCSLQSGCAWVSCQ